MLCLFFQETVGRFFVDTLTSCSQDKRKDPSVWASSSHGFQCKRSSGSLTKHRELNDQLCSIFLNQVIAIILNLKQSGNRSAILQIKFMILLTVFNASFHFVAILALGG